MKRSAQCIVVSMLAFVLVGCGIFPSNGRGSTGEKATDKAGEVIDGSVDAFPEPVDTVGHRGSVDHRRSGASGRDAGGEGVASVRGRGRADSSERDRSGVSELAGDPGADLDGGGEPDMGGARSTQGGEDSPHTISWKGRPMLTFGAVGLAVIVLVAVGYALYHRRTIKRGVRKFNKGAK